MTADASRGSLQSASLDVLAERLAPFFDDAAGVYWVSADLALVLRGVGADPRQAEAFADGLLQAIRKIAGPRATILVSAFNLDFPRTKVFDVATAPVQTGAFGGLLLKSNAGQRTPQPFYSFLAFGPKADALLERCFPNNTGENSIFEWVVAQRTTLITLGHHYVKSLSSVHHAEEVAGVPYRYRKSFAGDVVHRGRTRAETVAFYVRELGVCDHSSLTRAGDRHFRDLGLVKTLPLGPMLAHRINLADAHDEMVKDLRSGTWAWVNYLGPERQDTGVITADVANKLYLDELAAIRAAGP